MTTLASAISRRLLSTVAANTFSINVIGFIAGPVRNASCCAREMHCALWCHGTDRRHRAPRTHLPHYGRSPLADAATHLQSIRDGALAVGTDGVIAYCGPYSTLPQEFTSWTEHHHGGSCCPGSSIRICTSRRCIAPTPTAAANCWSGWNAASSPPRPAWPTPHWRSARRSRSAAAASPPAPLPRW